MRYTIVTRVQTTIKLQLDEEDAWLLDKHSWHLDKNGYLRSGTKDRKLVLHRIIMGAKVGQIVDHINGDVLDNRKANLRFVNANQNQHNRNGNKDSTSIYKGVSWDFRRRKWCAAIRTNNVSINLGRFDSEWDAAIAYDVAAEKHFGEFARTNFQLNLNKQTVK